MALRICGETICDFSKRRNSRLRNPDADKSISGSEENRRDFRVDR